MCYKHLNLYFMSIARKGCLGLGKPCNAQQVLDENFDAGPKGPELEGQQADREIKATHTRRKALSGTQPIKFYIMELMTRPPYSPSTTAAARGAHILFWCLCDYCVLVFLSYWGSINYTRLDELREVVNKLYTLC